MRVWVDKCQFRHDKTPHDMRRDADNHPGASVF